MSCAVQAKKKHNPVEFIFNPNSLDLFFILILTQVDTVLSNRWVECTLERTNLDFWNV